MEEMFRDKENITPNPMLLPRFLDAEQAADELHMHVNTVRSQAASGKLPAAKPGKCWVFIDVDLREWIRAQYKCAVSIDKEKVCHSIEDQIANIGGLLSRSQTAERYASLLKLPTVKQPKNGEIKNNTKRGSNGA